MNTWQFHGEGSATIGDNRVRKILYTSSRRLLPLPPSLEKVKSYGRMNSASRVAATPRNMGARGGGWTERNFSHVGMGLAWNTCNAAFALPNNDIRHAWAGVRLRNTEFPSSPYVLRIFQLGKAEMFREIVYIYIFLCFSFFYLLSCFSCFWSLISPFSY